MGDEDQNYTNNIDDETNNLIVMEDEPSLQIDESWYSSSEDETRKVIKNKLLKAKEVE